MIGRLGAAWRSDWVERWLWLVTLVWAATCAVFVYQRWWAIESFYLPDTDDNMRMTQVRAWLGGQGWFDLRQHKLNPPGGYNMHWSRLVDLPIAALQLVARPFVGGAAAERFSAGVAPMLPLWVALVALSLAVRRLIEPRAVVLALGIALCAQAALLMFMPMRVDHHGWQLALLALSIAGLADPRARRGGIVIGVASAMSLVIGLELMPFLVIVGGAVVLRWVWSPGDAPRMAGYGVALSLGCALGYLGFASNDNRVLRCDTLSPVWLATMVAAGWLAYLLSYLERDWRWRLGAAALGGVILIAGFALLAPQCLGRPEQVSDELYRSWLSNIREAKPLYKQAGAQIATTLALPLIGVVGAVLATWRARRTADFAVWAPVALVSAVSMLLLMWQTRMGAPAQLMAVPGATALAWVLGPRLLSQRRGLAVTATAVVAVVLLVSVIGMGTINAWLARPHEIAGLRLPALLTPDKPNTRMQTISRANYQCNSLAGMRMLRQFPRTTVFTFVDLGPRMITVTPHSAIAGPYHRNGEAILDVHHAFGGDPLAARAIMLRHGATMLVTCPNMSESTVYRSRGPRNFYSRLANGERFDWLEPVRMPKDSPLLAWRIR